MKKVAVTNFKGGVGKTTLAVNLAVLLSVRRKRRVLLVDTDPSANVTAHFRIHPRHTLAHLILEEALLEDVIMPVPEYEGLFLLPSSRGTQAAEFQIASRVGRERLLERQLDGLQGFDYLIFDTPPSVSIMAQNAFVSARQVVIPVSMDPMSLLGASSTLNLLKEVEEGLDVPCRVAGIVPTFVDERLVITRVVMDAIRERLAPAPLLPPIRSDTTVRKATASQTPVVEFAPESRASQDYERLCESLDQELRSS